MSIQNLLEQLLKSGTSTYEQAKQSGDLGKYAKGAAAGGALAILLGSRGGRNLGGKALKIGTVAALGTMAWKAYNEWQAKQAGQAASTPATPARFEQLPAPQLEQHSTAMLMAMIAAAKADGHMDERERGLVEAEMHRLDADPAVRGWVAEELRRPVEPAEVAARATSPEMAAEIYLASVVVADQTTTMERAYLDELARQLKLAPDLKANLEARAAAAA
jgi:uncharacterized membrane protein YebE (DUF533 family)